MSLLSRTRLYLRDKKNFLLLRIFHFLRKFDWKKMKSCKYSITGTGGLLVIPCDPWSLTGSRGDEAMLMVLQKMFPNSPLHIVTATPEASQVARIHGWFPEPCWQEKNLFANLLNVAIHIRPSACVILGADVMDGYYDADNSLALFAIADIMAHHGLPTSLLGFSFNSKPHPKVLKGLRRMDENFVYQLRDPVSLVRFEKATGLQAKLVSDVAFLLQPDNRSPKYSEISSWKKREGKRLLAINLHPMLIKNASPENIREIIETLHVVLDSLLQTTEWNILLLPHDDRGDVSDNICLKPLFQKLERWKNRVKHLDVVLDAAKMKGIASLADCLVTSRMHLGIAGLSQAIPTMGFTYQDKFQGMIEHFGLDKRFILPLPVMKNRQEIESKIKWLLDNKDKIRIKILDALPHVFRLAQENFSPLNINSSDSYRLKDSHDDECII